MVSEPSVVDRVHAHHLDGLITQFDLLAARQKLLEEERHAERVLTLRRVNSTARNGCGVNTDAPSESAQVA